MRRSLGASRKLGSRPAALVLMKKGNRPTNGEIGEARRGAMTRLGCGVGLLALMMGAAAADAQSVTNMAALKGLAPVSALSKTVDGVAALGSNFTVTGGIQTGAVRQPTLLPFAEQQQQAL